LTKDELWVRYLILKIKSENNKSNFLRPLLNSKIVQENKILIYKSIIRPVRYYKIVIRRPAKPSNIRPIHAFQSITLRLTLLSTLKTFPYTMTYN